MMNYEIFKEVVKEKFMDYMESLSRSVAFLDQGFLKQWKLPAQFPVGLLLL